MDVSVGPADSDETFPRVTRAIVILRACEECRDPQLRAKARLTILAPRSAPAPSAGKTDVRVCGRGGGHHKVLGGVRLCSGRLCGRGLPRHFRTPRSARAPSTGLRLL